MESGGGGGSGNSTASMMMLGSYGGDHTHDVNIEMHGLSGGSGGNSHHPHPHAMMMMMMPLSSTATPDTTTSTFHSYHQHQHHLSHSGHTTNLPPLPPPLGAGVGCGGSSSNGSHFMILDNYYHPKSQQNLNANDSNSHGGDGGGDGTSSIKAKIMAHPHYPRLLAAYVNCQKVGAPPEVVARLEEAFDAAVRCVRRSGGGGGEELGMAAGELGEDPSLDQFMEAYCEMLSKYEQELTKPFKEAMLFLSRIESQFKSLSLSSSSSSADSTTACGETIDRNGSSEEEIDVNTTFVDPLAEDRELKCQLLRKYSGYLGSLKQEFMKKRKKGKLPKEARQQLLEWWTRHYKWPYPSESQKMALAEATGLDLKQINNWFINQRKRHWKPSEDMQFVMMDATTSSHHHPHYYMDNMLGTPFPMDVSPALL